MSGKLNNLNLLDCTLRDGGYYNSWDFSSELVSEYLSAMKAAQIDIVELGFRFLKNQGFKGPYAYTTDAFLRAMSLPSGMDVGVMVNGSDLCTELGTIPALERLFPEPAETTPVTLVRIACHFHELAQVFPAVDWLHARGYRVGINLMQIADRPAAEIVQFARMSADWPVEVVYFADSMGSITPDDVARIVADLRIGWDGPLGIHTHDNMGLALSNTLRAQAEGVSWLDATVTGMGRGPGNAQTEELVIEAEVLRARPANMVPLMGLVRKHFGPMKEQYGWGTNPYYYLAGKYGIHPTYIQEMLGDARYGDEDILAVIDHLRAEGGKKFSSNTLDGARQFYFGAPRGTWEPASRLAGREVMILGTGPGVETHRAALEAYISRAQPVVMALNAQSVIDPELIDLRVACHPVRMLADAATHAHLPQPLITPASMLPERLRKALGEKELLDFGLGIEADTFEFHSTHCIVPTSLVVAYALAVATSGQATRVLLAGFDGYPAGDMRNVEMQRLVFAFLEAASDSLLSAVTPSQYPKLPTLSLYGL